jgi:prepilin-type N-terminal cleavage/methylation domain-containing protein
MRNNARGFTLVELLTVIGIIGVIATIVVVALGSTTVKARDVKRKQALASVGRFMAGSRCFVPAAGDGDYDLADLMGEVKAKHAAAAALQVPRDPRGGTAEETGYRYRVSGDGKLCALYANLENEEEEVTLSGVAEPGVTRGTGVLLSDTEGRNGTRVFFQVTN